MFNSKKARIEKVDTVIGDGTAFSGNVKATGIVRVDGVMNGEIETQGDVIVGDKGRVDGSIKGRNVTIAGKVGGNIDSDEKLHLLSTGTIDGDILVKSLVVDEGGSYLGKCTMKGDGAQASKKGKEKKEQQAEK